MSMSESELQQEREYWESIIYNEDGTLNEDAILAELYDFRFIMQQASHVYSEVTGGMLSKPNYYASGVLQAHGDYMEEIIQESRNEAVKDALDMLEAGHTRDEILKEFPTHEY